MEQLESLRIIIVTAQIQLYIKWFIIECRYSSIFHIV